MTLLTLAQAALEEVGETEIPTTFVGNQNTTARRVLALANRAGRLLVTEPEDGWESLVFERSFTTTAGQEVQTGAIPADFRYFVNGTWWDGTNFWPLVGPVTARKWQELKRGIASQTSSAHRWFRLRGGNVLLYPDPPNGTDTIYFEYGSKFWVDTDADGIGEAEDFQADTDTSLIDEDLLKLDLIWRYKHAIGIPYEEDYNTAREQIEKGTGRDGGAPALALARRRVTGLIGYGNIPDTGYGA